MTDIDEVFAADDPRRPWDDSDWRSRDATYRGLGPDKRAASRESSEFLKKFVAEKVAESEDSVTLSAAGGETFEAVLRGRLGDYEGSFSYKGGDETVQLTGVSASELESLKDGAASDPNGPEAKTLAVRVALTERRNAERTARTSTSVSTDPKAFHERARLIDWPDFWAAEPLPTEWILPGVIGVGLQTAIWSPPKAGKSLILQEAAIKLALGDSIFGLPARPPMRVLYIDHENTRRDLFWRLSDMGYKGVIPENFFYSLLGDWPPLDTAAGGVALEAAAIKTNAGLIIIDTASRTIEGGEDKADTWAGWYRHTGVRIKRLEKALVRLDHSGKDATRGMRGSSAKAADVDLIVQLAKVPTGVLLTVMDERVKVEDEHRTTLLSRYSEPLRHVIEDGRAAKAATDIARAIERLDDHDVPAGMSYNKAQDRAKADTEAGTAWKVPSKAVFGVAQSARRERDGLADTTDPTAGES